jgi:hypothetical protein
MPESHDHRSAAHGVINKFGDRRVTQTEARGSNKPQGRRPTMRAGVSRDVKVPYMPTKVIEPTGQVAKTLRMQEPTTRKRGQLPNS